MWFDGSLCLRWNFVCSVFLPQVKSGEIPMDKVPYMQRGGAWDDSDLTKKGAAKMALRKEKVVNNNTTSKKIAKKDWSDTDKAYANVRIPSPCGRSAFVFFGLPDFQCIPTGDVYRLCTRYQW